ncbi:hypothetical protein YASMINEVIRUS_87 [Yasminevirus sp. GU-2018]|uniref:Uncharacterized protein n=1 Tax=Yasminevirus sp. GU-2018 TaxID=2420051 RepID=A0A5K0U801_9VIRU|nr:hypothetical protein YASMINEVIRUS_87 [Yasminevirus sp. GU-2018]
MAYQTKCGCSSGFSDDTNTEPKNCGCDIRLRNNEIFNDSGEGIARQPKAQGKILNMSTFITNFIEVAKTIKTCGDKTCPQDLCKMDEVLLSSGQFIAGLARQPKAEGLLMEVLIAKCMFYYNYFILSKCCYDKKELMNIIVTFFNRLIAKYDIDPNAVCCPKQYLKIECGIIVINYEIDFPCTVDPSMMSAFAKVFDSQEQMLEGLQLKRFFLYLLNILKDDCNKGRYGELLTMTTKTLDYINRPVDGIDSGCLLTRYYKSGPVNEMILPGLLFCSRQNVQGGNDLCRYMEFLMTIYMNITFGLTAYLNKFVSTHQCCKPKDPCKDPCKEKCKHHTHRCHQQEIKYPMNNGGRPSTTPPLYQQSGCGCKC